ncbi:MAG: penicillin-binding protein 2 [Candidatus Jorgensenbacteria bacterium]|nr:penicillin-binding protein 2 [Candidatus Jorgensenbacteria bacterium]
MRFIVLASFFTTLFLVLSFNLYNLQINKGAFYFGQAEARTEAIKELELRRGQIFLTDRSGGDIPAALNKDYPVVYAVPKNITNVREAAHALTGIVGIQEEKLSKMLDNPSSLFRLIVDKASPEVVSAVTSASIPGIYTNSKQYRFYPFERLLSQALGFVGVNEKSPDPAGLYGIEKLQNTTLADGEDVRLTIDRNLQAESEQMLTDLIKKFNAVGGSVIIQESKTGKILTLASKPDFDPNVYSDSPVKNFLNPAVQQVYEPGSVFKPLTMAAGIDSGALTPSTTYVDKGKVTLNGMTILNWDKKAHGKITMTQVIEDSVNTGAIFAEQKTGNNTFSAYVKQFGFGELTGVDLPDEVSGSIQNLFRKEARAVDFATISFGQGVSVTPVQLISAFSAIANGGVLMKPFVTADTKPVVIRRVIREDTARQVTGMMESAVEKAKIAAIPNYNIAGKTGTAFIPARGGYSEDLIQSYVGFFPASDPVVTVLIKLDKPNAPLAGMTVVPAFHDLASYIINYYNIPPDKPIAQKP